MHVGNLKNTEKYYWTEHAKFKMKFYGLSPQRVLRVIRNPERIEDGIVEKTTAVMQPASIRTKNGKKTWSSEIWCMFQKVKSPKSKVKMQNDNEKLKNKVISNKLMKLQANKLRIISAWRYPGVSPKNNPIPEEILEEISELE